MVFQQTVLQPRSANVILVSFQDLGLATSRGRGKCKNPSCSYVYTNRHKPRICPKCGYNLAKDRAEKTGKSLVRFDLSKGCCGVDEEVCKFP